jgi:hypothetical protein
VDVDVDADADVDVGEMITCVKPASLFSSRWRRSAFSMRFCSLACCARRPGTMLPRMQRPRAPLSCLSRPSSLGWATVCDCSPGLTSSSTCGRHVHHACMCMCMCMACACARACARACGMCMACAWHVHGMCMHVHVHVHVHGMCMCMCMCMRMCMCMCMACACACAWLVHVHGSSTCGRQFLMCSCPSSFSSSCSALRACW